MSLSIATGASLANCDSFSKLAITEDLPTAPATPASYTYTCSASPAQNLSYVLQNGLGPHTLYLWAMNAAGNISATPSMVAIDYSLIVPTVAITTPATANLPFQSSVAISGTCEDDSGDVSLSGPISGSPQLTSCVGNAFSKTVSLTGADGTKTITASQTNQFGNTGSGSIAVIKDTTAPSLAIASAAPASTNAASFSATATFSEAVTGFNASKISASNASISAFSGSGSTYNFRVTPTAQGQVTVDIAAGAGQDAAGNSSLAASTFPRTFDTVVPSVTLSAAPANPTRLSPLSVTATFSEAVSGFNLAALSLTNATAGSLSGSGTTYTFQLSPSGQRAFSIGVAVNAATDAAGNGNSASSSLSRTYDSVVPTLTLSSAAPDPTNTTPIPVVASFSESVSGFSLSSISVTNGTAGNFTGSGASYSFDVTPSSNSPVVVNVAAGSAQDTAGNSVIAPGALSRTFNTSHPTVILSSTRTSPSKLSPFPFTAIFSSSVSGFDDSDLVVSNATISGFTGSGTTYTFTAMPTADGNVSLSVPAASGIDGASNTNLASNTLTILYDTTAPTLSVTNPSAGAYINLASQASFSMTGACSEEGRPVSLAVGSVSASPACTGGAFSDSLDLQSLADGSLSLTYTQTDAAGNTSAAASVSLVKNTTAPALILSGQPSGSSNAAALKTTIGGSGVVAYRYKVCAGAAVDCNASSGYSAEIAVATAITDSLTSLAGSSIGCAKAFESTSILIELTALRGFSIDEVALPKMFINKKRA